ncbi:MAG: NUDIX hydrolase [Anaerolineales bacterium]|nr:NUDIX hydrolase [Anaerolineales bacterium]MCB0016693.1 NUDIX hydrolase [Anaerolineales bacterium]
MNHLGENLKPIVARLLRLPGMVWLMKLGILFVVPRHRLGVQAVVLNENNEVLLLEHVFHPYAPWGLPGGWLNRHEDPRRAVIRELFEETGLQGELGPPLYVERVSVPHQLTLAFLVRAKRQQLSLSGEILSARWFGIDNLPNGMYGFNYEAIMAAQRLLTGNPAFEPVNLR